MKELSRFAACCLTAASVAFAAKAEETPRFGILRGFCACPATDTAPFPLWGSKALPSNITCEYGQEGTRMTQTGPRDLLAADDPVPDDAFLYSMVYGLTGGNLDTSKTPSFTFTGLEPGAAYELGVYAPETYFNGDGRSFHLLVNGEQPVCTMNGAVVSGGVMHPYRDAGNRRYTSVRYSHAVTADANGTLSGVFVNDSNNASISAIVLFGTNAPSAKPALDVQPSGVNQVLSWTASDWACGYEVQRKVDDEAWTTIGRTVTLTYTDLPPSQAGSCRYRVVATNGNGFVESDVAQSQTTRTRRYALNFGTVYDSVGFFVPAGPHLSNAVVTVSFPSGAAEGVDPDYAGAAAIYTTYAVPYVSSDNNVKEPIVVRLANLSPETTYSLRLHTMEVDTAQAGARLFDIAVNGTVVKTDVDAYVLAGNRLRVPALVDFDATSDADGRIDVTVIAKAGMPVVCALEAFEVAAALPRKPVIAVQAFAEYVHLAAGFDEAQGVFDYEYAASADAASGTTLFAGTAGFDVRDFSVPAGVTRYYRARERRHGKTGEWSDWTPAARSAVSFGTPTKIDFCLNEANVTPGWLWSEGHRIDGEVKQICNIDAANVITEGVADAAPVSVYANGVYKQTMKPLCYSFAGFDPGLTYRIRVHLAESWTMTSGGRVWSCALNGTVENGGALRSLDAYRTSGARYKAGVVETTCRPSPDGIFRIDVCHQNNYGELRGIEFVPNATMTFGPAVCAYDADVGEASADVENTRFVAEGNHAGFTWTASDLPEGVSGTVRLRTDGMIFAPAGGTYQISVTGKGTSRIWLDGEIYLNRTHVDKDMSSDGGLVYLSAGPHAYHLSYQAPSAADFGLQVSWQRGGAAIAAADFQGPGAATLRTGDWRLFARGNNASPSFVVPKATDGKTYRIYGSGKDLWSTSDDGTIFFRKLRGPFHMKMRVTGFGGEVVHNNTRLGVMMRSRLDNMSQATDFSCEGGLNAQKQNTGFVTVGADCRYAGWGDVTTDTRYAAPLWIRAVRTNLPGGQMRLTVDYSKDGETWFGAKTQDVPRLREIYIGPYVLAHHTAGEHLTWMEIDNLEAERDVPGLTVIVR